MLAAFTKGFVLSFGLVAPLGAQNAFIFNQAASQPSYRDVLPVVITTIVCDALLILLAAFGASIMPEILFLKSILSLVASVFLLYLCVLTWNNSTEFNENQLILGSIKQISYTLSISLANPHAILDTFLVIGPISSEYSETKKYAFIFGCIMVDIIWFFTLSACGFFIRHLRNRGLIIALINKTSAIIMFLIAMNLALHFFNDLISTSFF